MTGKTNAKNHSRPQGQEGNAMRFHMVIGSRRVNSATPGWDVVGKVRLSGNGRGPVCKRLQGSHYSALAREAARQFAESPAIRWCDFRVGSEDIRIHAAGR